MSTFHERENNSLVVDDDAFIIKPVPTKKRSLSSLLSLDNNIDESVVNVNGNVVPMKRRKVSGSSSSIIDSKWELNIEQIPELPFLYLKERTSVVVVDENPQRAQLIASNIVQCAKKIHAYGQYSTEKVSSGAVMQ